MAIDGRATCRTWLNGLIPTLVGSNSSGTRRGAATVFDGDLRPEDPAPGSGNFTFVVMTDREDSDNQFFGTFVGCGMADYINRITVIEPVSNCRYSDVARRAGSANYVEREIDFSIDFKL